MGSLYSDRTVTKTPVSPIQRCDYKLAPPRPDSYVSSGNQAAGLTLASQGLDRLNHPSSLVLFLFYFLKKTFKMPFLLQYEFFLKF